MGVAAILVMRPDPPPPTPNPCSPDPWSGGSIWNLALIGPAVSEEKMFEEFGWRTDDRACLYYKLTHEPFFLAFRA